MFLARRAAQAEYFDSPNRPHAEIVESYTSLASVNRLFAFAEPFQRLLPKFLGKEYCASLSILDLGAGDGSLGKLLAEWSARRQNWTWRVTSLDINVSALLFNKGGQNVAGSALALPFRDNSFDVVIASQMTHHLTRDDQVLQHLSEAWRVAKQAIFFTDLHRGPILYGLLWLFFQLRRYPEHFRNDGLLSVRRGFRIHELQKLARNAGMSGARASLYYGTRVILHARKSVQN